MSSQNLFSCYVCSGRVSKLSPVLIKTWTNFLTIDLPTKISQIVGNRSIVAVSSDDRICSRCLNLINELDQSEKNVIVSKNRILDLLEEKYHFEEDPRPKCTVKNEGKTIQKPDDFQDCEEVFLSDSDDDLKQETYVEVEIESEIDGNSSNSQYKCDYCGSSFETAKKLKSHGMKSHSELRCPVCEKEFHRVDQYENHINYFHNQQCSFCGKKIEEAKKLKEHVQRHIRNKSFDCDLCNRTFKVATALKNHRSKHTGSYKLFCEFCRRGFNDKSTLEKHRVIHTNEPSYVCDICGRKFLHPATFRTHKLLHSDPFPHKCHICDKQFRFPSAKVNHVRREHTGETPFKCDQCDEEFPVWASLQKHVIGHTNKFPFNCDACSKGFTRKRSLGRHLAKVHLDKSLLAVKKCEYKIALKPDEYKNHQEL